MSKGHGFIIFLGRNLHWFYFNTSVRQIAIHFARANLAVICEPSATMEGAPQILIVDDDAASRKLLARLLTGAGYDCREAENAPDALKIVREQQPAVLLLDYKMPHMDGAEALRRF